MHDMMAVNRGIEVYLLNKSGDILYSVVLKHNENEPMKSVTLAPIEKFINTEGEEFVLGDDPLNPEKQNIFSAAPFSIDGHEGYIYIIVAGKQLGLISDSLFGTYFTKLSIGAMVLTMLFAALIGILSIWFLTKNLRLITHTVRKFQEGDLDIRIANPEESDIEVVALSFNKMADTIVENMDKMKSVDNLRRELIANVSHDLRTPLQITHDNIDKLSSLINQLFEYSKLEAEQVTPIKEPFSITELSHDLIAKFKILAEQKQVQLQLDNPEENYMVYADIGLVERALQNLIENAIKYTEPKGKVTLSLIKMGKQIEINITDTGNGIPVSDQPFIFDRYKQVDNTTKKQGLGLGLAIVKKIMDLHDTTIIVLSKPYEGSSFIFKLPAHQLQ